MLWADVAASRVDRSLRLANLDCHDALKCFASACENRPTPAKRSIGKLAPLAFGLRGAASCREIAVDLKEGAAADPDSCKQFYTSGSFAPSGDLNKHEGVFAQRFVSACT